MTWVRIDTSIFDHPKMMAVTPLARLLHIAGLCWSAGQLTDGAIPARGFDLVSIRAGVVGDTALDLAAELVEAGLWTTTGPGWEIHGYLEWQTPAETVREQRERDAERKRAARETKRVRQMSARTPSGLRPESARSPENVRSIEVEVEVEKPFRRPSVTTVGTETAQQTTDDDDEHLKSTQKTERAVQLIAAHQLETTPTTIRNTTIYLRKCVNEARSLHAAQLEVLASEHRDWTPEQLADAVIRPAVAAGPPGDPRGTPTAFCPNHNGVIPLTHLDAIGKWAHHDNCTTEQPRTEDL